MLKKPVGISVAGVLLLLVLAVAMAAPARAGEQSATEKTKSAAHRTATFLTDTAITTAVKTRLLADTKVSGLKISVETDKGVVTLTGDVGSAVERARAARIARNTKGVKRVVSKLTVVPPK